MDNYVGRVYAVDSRPCTHSPCLNNGTCIENGNLSDSASLISGSGSSSYVCECGEYFYGRNCENRVNLCSNVTCLNYGRCAINTITNQANCSCVNGYSGSMCEIESSTLKQTKQVSSVAGLVPIFVFAGIYLLMMFFDVVTIVNFSKKLRHRKPKPHVFRPVYRP